MNTFDEQIQLISLDEGIDDHGFPAVVETVKSPILANLISVKSNDYWQAKTNGVKLVYGFEVHAFEYRGEEKAMYKNEKYDIERTFPKNDLTEIYLSRESDDHAT
jgi:hypothetical protein